MQGEANGPVERYQRSYTDAIKKKKKENITIIKPKIQEESEVTKKLIKVKVDIRIWLQE